MQGKQAVLHRELSGERGSRRSFHFPGLSPRLPLFHVL